MPDFSKAQLYMVRSNDADDEFIYYGSTCSPLCKRMALHRWDFRNNNGCSSRQVFDNYGLENCHIELIKAFPCQSRAELEAEEFSYIRTNSCVNKHGKGRDIENRNTCAKQYYQDHKAEIAERAKQYHQDHKAEDNEKAKQYREDHKAEIAERVKTKITCECGAIINKANISTHRKSKIHKENLSNM